MLTESSCTLYLRKGEGFERCVVPACHWQESLASNVLKSGLQDANGITVYVFEKDLDGDLRAAAQDLIVKGECDFTFDNSTPQKASESLRELNSRFEAHTVMSVDRLLYGSEELRHYKISAR